MRPLKEELINLDIEEAMDKFGVCRRTIVRWMQHYDLFHRTGSGKLDMTKARKIRQKYSSGESMKELSEEYHVTIATISRVVHGITHKDHESAKVNVCYNI